MSNFAIAMRRVLSVAAILLVFGWVLVGSAGAQGDELRLSLRRDFGYGGPGNQIQGLFTASVSGVSNISSVSFELDGKEMASVSQPPFKYQFNTDGYPNGVHVLSAIAYTSDGRTLKSNTITADFISAKASQQATQHIMIPLLALVGLIIVLSTVGPLVLSGRKKRHFEPGEPRNYGAAGGTICPKCGRPFALSFLSLHLWSRKLERCPYCGKWGLVSRATPEALAAAEAAEVEASKPVVAELSPEEKLRRQIEESKYQ
jgi:hypothetical protein